MKIRKILFLLSLTVCSIVVCTGCQFTDRILKYENKNINPGDNMTEQVQVWMSRVCESSTYEEAAKWFCPDEDEGVMRQVYDNLKNNFRDKEICATFCGMIDDKDILMLEYEDVGEIYKELIVFEDVSDLGYRYCCDDEIWKQVDQKIVCGNCGGSGQVVRGGDITCGICSGSGQQYIPNLSYDPVMGWMGGWIGCSGCGGSGYTGNASYDICVSCSGKGLTY